jgi:protein O-mannosyl-transferase
VTPSANKFRAATLLAGLSLAAAVFLAYLPAWTGEFIWDDDAYVTKPALRSVAGLARIWLRPGATLQYYPLVHSVFWMEYKLWADNTLGYHLVNIFLHVVASLLLWRVLRVLEIPGALLAAAIFALHPVQVETVAWITELKNTLSAVFYFGAALAYLRFDQNRNGSAYADALVFFSLALMSKTVAASLPAALLVVFWWKRGTLGFKRDVAPLLPFFAVGIAAGLFTGWMEKNFVGANGTAYGFTFVERCLVAGRAVWFYMGKLIWPVNLSFSYPRWQIDPVAPWQWLFPVSLVLLLLILWCWRRQQRAPLAALLFFVGTLFPALGFVNVFPFIYSFVADHFQYLACVGPIVVTAAALEIQMLRLPAPAAFLRPVIYAVLLLTLGVLTWRQGRIYVDPDTLWVETIKRNPASWLAHNNLGLSLMGQSKLDDALSHFQSAIAIAPTQPQPHLNAGMAYLKKGDATNTIIESQKALDLQPTLAKARVDLGVAFMIEGKKDEAIGQYKIALALQPHMVAAETFLGEALAGQGRRADAISHFKAALQYAPTNASLHKDLGFALAQNGETQEAIAQLQIVLQIDPDNIEACDRLAWWLATSTNAALRNGPVALALARHAAELTDTGNPLILRTLAAAEAETGNYSNALRDASAAQENAAVRKENDLAARIAEDSKLYQSLKPARY